MLDAGAGKGRDVIVIGGFAHALAALRAIIRAAASAATALLSIEEQAAILERFILTRKGGEDA